MSRLHKLGQTLRALYHTGIEKRNRNAGREMMGEKLEAMLPTGEWVVLAEWDGASDEYDADDWLDAWAERIGNSSAPLPGGGRVDLSRFVAVRGASST